MRLRLATCLTFALLLAAGLDVCGGSADAQTASPKKTTSARSGASAHRTKSSKRSRRRERGQKVPTSDRISEIQQALGKDGSYAGTPTGKWDAPTIEAMKKFQESHGLNPTGKLDAKTLQQLGLGSETAGVAAPLPSANTSRLTTPQTQTARRQK